MLLGSCTAFCFAVKKFAGPEEEAPVRCCGERFLYRSEMRK